MNLKPLPLSHLRPAGWLIPALDRSDTRLDWMVRCLSVGGGKGRIEARRWVDQQVAAHPAVPGTDDLRALAWYQAHTGDLRAAGVLATSAAVPGLGREPDAFEALLGAFWEGGRRDEADALEALAFSTGRFWGPYLAHQVVADPEGLRAVFYTPATVKTTVAGSEVTLEFDTDYPQDPRVVIRYSAGGPAAFTLFLRVPAWAEGLRVVGPGASAALMTDDEGWLFVRRLWSPGDELELTFEGPLPTLSR